MIQHRASTITVAEAFDALLAVTAIIDVCSGPEDSSAVYCDGMHAFDIPAGATTLPAALVESALNDLAGV